MKIYPQETKLSSRVMVYSNFCIARHAKDYTATVRNLVTPMLGYFQESNYGKGVNEVAFYMVSVEPEEKKYYGLENGFQRKRKSIGCSFEVPIETVVNLPVREQVDVIITAFLQSIEDFKTLKIKEFDLALFKTEIEEFLLKSKNEVLVGNTLQVNPLKEEIVTEINRKFANL